MRSLGTARSLRSGQTLIIALLVLGALLIVAFVFIGIVANTISGTTSSRQRTVSQDLADAGINFAHDELETSTLGADWRGTPTVAINGRDPDSDLLQPTNWTPPPATPGAQYQGPDGLGPWTRVSFPNGRALTRVRYTSDASLFAQALPSSVLNPGKARSFMIIESIGRPGVVNGSDPTLLAATSNLGVGVTKDQYKEIAYVPLGVTDTARFITNKYNVNRPADVGSPLPFPFSYGAYYGYNPATLQNTVTNPIWPTTTWPNGNPLNLPQALGTMAPLDKFTQGQVPTTPVVDSIQPFGASLRSNADLRVFGEYDLNLCPDLGDGIFVAGKIEAADNNGSEMKLNVARWSPTLNTYSDSTAIYNFQPNGSGGYVNTPLSSDDPNFSTNLGLVRDGISGIDNAGFARGVGRIEPPSLETIDPASGVSRYLRLSRDSGVLEGTDHNGNPNTPFAANSGNYGHGRNVYVYNPSDLQVSSDEQGRIDEGTAQALEYDWLNPNNNEANSGWNGFFYIPRGAFVQLMDDGFIITRDVRGPATENTWHYPDGTDSGESTLRFRVGDGTDGLLHVLNRLEAVSIGTLTTADFDAGTVSAAEFQLAPLFDGVLYFEGNVRVRGTIPADVQLSLVSGGTIYIEGSITKGTLAEFASPGFTAGQRLNRPSKSAIGLFARQYVCLNTTQFFGPGADQSVQPVNDVPSTVGYSPVRIPQPSGALQLVSEESLDPTSGGNPLNPAAWSPYALEYTPATPSTVDTATSADPFLLSVGAHSDANFLGYHSLLLTHTMDDGAAPETFFQLAINKGLNDYSVGLSSTPPPYEAFQTYLFTASPYNLATSLFSEPYTTPGYDPTLTETVGDVPVYGLGGEDWQRYSKFETTTFPLTVTGSTYPLAEINAGDSPYAFHAFDGHGTYKLLAGEPNSFELDAASVGSAGVNDYLVARAGLLPHDIRIEAAIYAEEGSFFVIPGPWFNPNPNDRRDLYDSQGSDAADQYNRLANYGNNPEAPFYGEPIDVRIQIVGSVAENMPPPMSVQEQWLTKWGSIPAEQGASGKLIPTVHIPVGTNFNDRFPAVPNLTISYDPMLATGRASGFNFSSSYPPMRTDSFGRALPPIPRMPVSATIAYEGAEK